VPKPLLDEDSVPGLGRVGIQGREGDRPHPTRIY
jgi:hypothetical protein